MMDFHIPENNIAVVGGGEIAAEKVLNNYVEERRELEGPEITQLQT